MKIDYLVSKSPPLGSCKTKTPMTTFAPPSYLSLPEAFYSEVLPEAAPKPQVLLWNQPLASLLGLDQLSEIQRQEIFSGNHLPEGARPLAQAYAGHQFGHFTMLGDGRAVLLTERQTEQGRLDVQLKGSGRTPYSRNGDGRATLKSMLREHLISEAMFYLGIPTSRSLAVVKTGLPVYRETPQEGAVLTRIASSHLRVGTFEYARYLAQPEDLSSLFQYAAQRHDPHVLNAAVPALGFLESVMQRQLTLIVHWMRVGFIHGVMNTDNMGIAGETFDYGPCAFMNAYHPDTVFSSIDTQGRYAFGNQPIIARWNLAGLAMALLPLIHEDSETAAQMAKQVLDNFMPQYRSEYLKMMGHKLGLAEQQAEDVALIENLADWMQAAKADYTNTFLVLSGDLPENGLWASEAFVSWKAQWRMRCGQAGPDLALMRKNNPLVIPRNHQVEQALDMAVSGDWDVFNQLLAVLSQPYIAAADLGTYQQPPTQGDAGFQTFCGT
jgi:uncharacterized protein YdiU (UPF0061 family)